MRLTYKPFNPPQEPSEPPPPPVEEFYETEYYVQEEDAGKFVMIFIAGAIAMAILDSLK